MWTSNFSGSTTKLLAEHLWSPEQWLGTTATGGINTMKPLTQQSTVELEKFKGVFINHVTLLCKLMGLGVPNRIIDNSDFKPADFDHRFQSNSDFNNEIVSTI